MAVGLMAGVALVAGAIAADPNGIFGEITAAWVQAIGSIGAILGAAWIAHGESRARQERQLAEDRRAATEQRALLGSCCAILDEGSRVVDDIIDQASDRLFGSLMHDDGRLAELATAMAAFPIQLIGDGRVVEAFFSTRSSIAAVRHALGSVGSFGELGVHEHAVSIHRAAKTARLIVGEA